MTLLERAIYRAEVGVLVCGTLAIAIITVCFQINGGMLQ
jgi:hypothetical protein